jgi:hypothetical protein
MTQKITKSRLGRFNGMVMDYPHREALYLLSCSGLSNAKIAAMTGIPTEDVQALRALPQPAPHPGAKRSTMK